MDFIILMEMILAASGVYMMYSSIQMKINRKIPEALVGKGFRVDKAKDPEGFIDATFLWTFLAGLTLFAIGVVNSFGFLAAYPILEGVVSIIMIIVVIAYSSFILKAQKKYILGMNK